MRPPATRASSPRGGRFVAPIDADDLWHPDYVATLVERLTSSDPPAVMAHAVTRLIDPRSRVLGSALAVGLEGKVARAGHRNA